MQLSKLSKHSNTLANKTRRLIGHCQKYATVYSAIHLRLRIFIWVGISLYIHVRSEIMFYCSSLASPYNIHSDRIPEAITPRIKCFNYITKTLPYFSPSAYADGVLPCSD